MSTTGNEFEQPGVNYPDREDAGGAQATPESDEPKRDDPEDTQPGRVAEAAGAASDPDHHGQDDGRDTLTAGQAQRAMSDDQAQRLPAMSQNNADDVDKAAGIVAQTRQDVAHLGHDRVVEVLRQRLDQSGVDVPDDEVEELARQVLEGDATGADVRGATTEE